jgi:hypothetical protein
VAQQASIWRRVRRINGLRESKAWAGFYLLPAGINKGKPRNWLIGSYGELQKLAQRLRFDDIGRSELQRAELLTFARARKKERMIFGRRIGDDPPVIPWRRRYGFNQREMQEYADWNPMPEDEDDDRRRIQFQKVREFWEGKSLEAHHIFEDNFVEKLLKAAGKTPDGDLQRSNAPCVLLSADFHQGYFREHTVGSDITSKNRIELLEMYNKVYGGDEFAGLLKIAKIVIDEISQMRPVTLQ